MEEVEQNQMEVVALAEVDPVEETEDVAVQKDQMLVLDMLEAVACMAAAFVVEPDA